MRADTQAFGELVELLKTAEQQFLNDRNQRADEDIADNYKHLLDLVSLGIDCYVQNDFERPRLVSLVSPHRKIGGDNAHALYHFAPLLADRRYRLCGSRNQTAYMGFTVYGGDTEQQVDIQANINSGDIDVDDDGNFAITIGPETRDNRNHIQTKPAGAVFLVIREYFFNQRKEGPARLAIEPLDNPGKPPLLNEAEMARRIRSMVHTVRGWTALSPMPWPDDDAAYNQLAPPFRTGESTGHWSTPDNIHTFGFFKLAEDEALVMEGRSPDCLYWSCHLWNSCMQTFDYENYQCALSQDDVQLNDDGSWQLVIARRDPGVRNWLDTTGYEKGFVYFRWLNAVEIPGPIACRRVKISEL